MSFGEGLLLSMHRVLIPDIVSNVTGNDEGKSLHRRSSSAALADAILGFRARQGPPKIPYAKIHAL